MSKFITVSSVCGDAKSSMDIFDLELNPHGVICCANCQLIIEARESWASVFDYSFSN